jgi:hypothetical protein
MYGETQVWKYLDVEQEGVVEGNKSIISNLSSFDEHVQLVDGKTSEDLVDIVMEWY